MLDRRHLPQGLTDWIGIAGFVVASLTLILARIDTWRERASVIVDTPTRAPAKLDRPVSLLVTDARPEDAVLWSFMVDRVAALAGGKQARVVALIDGKAVEIGRPLSLTAVLTNTGRRPLRFVSATATYGTLQGQLRRATKRIDIAIDESHRRAVVQVTVKDSELFSVPLAVGLLDELGQCHTKAIPGDGAAAFRDQLHGLKDRQFCEDPDLEQVVTIP